MMIVNDDARKLVLRALENEISQLEIERGIPLADRMDDDAALDALIGNYKFMHQAVLDNRYVIFDTQPRCMATVPTDENGNNKQCENAAQFAPLVVVYGPDGRTPIAQMETNPPLRLCEKHATGNVDHYIDNAGWAKVAEQCVKQTGQIVRKDDARIMFMDSKTGQLVPPPSVSIVGG